MVFDVISSSTSCCMSHSRLGDLRLRVADLVQVRRRTLLYTINMIWIQFKLSKLAHEVDDKECCKNKLENGEEPV